MRAAFHFTYTMAGILLLVGTAFSATTIRTPVQPGNTWKYLCAVKNNKDTVSIFHTTVSVSEIETASDESFTIKVHWVDSVYTYTTPGKLLSVSDTIIEGYNIPKVGCCILFGNTMFNPFEELPDSVYSRLSTDGRDYYKRSKRHVVVNSDTLLLLNDLRSVWDTYSTSTIADEVGLLENIGVISSLHSKSPWGSFNTSSSCCALQSFNGIPVNVSELPTAARPRHYLKKTVDLQPDITIHGSILRVSFPVLPLENKFSLEAYDPAGKIVLKTSSGKNESFSTVISSLMSGLHIIVVKAGQHIWYKKIIVR